MCGNCQNTQVSKTCPFYIKQTQQNSYFIEYHIYLTMSFINDILNLSTQNQAHEVEANRGKFTHIYALFDQKQACTVLVPYPITKIKSPTTHLFIRIWLIMLTLPKWRFICQNLWKKHRLVLCYCVAVTRCTLSPMAVTNF